MKWFSPILLFPKGSVLKWFTFSWGVGGIFTKILRDGHFEKCFQGGIQYDPSIGRGRGMEWPIDPLSEGNCESVEYILLLKAAGSVLPQGGNTNNTFS